MHYLRKYYPNLVGPLQKKLKLVGVVLTLRLDTNFQHQIMPMFSPCCYDMGVASIDIPCVRPFHF
jgi:hypothetical protein